MNQCRPVRPSRPWDSSDSGCESRDSCHVPELKKGGSNMDIRLQNTNINFT